MRASLSGLLGTVMMIVTLVASANGQDFHVPLEQHHLRSFLLAAYPELDGRAIEIEAFGKGPALIVDVSETSTAVGSVRPTRHRLLNASVLLSEDKEIRSFQANGELLLDQSNAALARSLAQAVRAGQDGERTIAAQQLVFGPDKQAAILSRVQQRNLSERLGAIQVLSITPRVMRDNAAYGFLWSVEVAGTQSGRGPQTYELLLEPIGGQLISVRVK